MLDPTRYSLDAATVGFRKRMNLEVDWDAFKIAMQTQNESVKVRRELEETPINEVHVMGGEQFGYAGNSKFNETARQQRQINGYVLRSFLATGGPLVVPSKRSDPLIATQGTMGHSLFVLNSADMGESVSAFTEPLYGALDSNAMSMGRAGLEAMSESISNPYQKLQFMLNMHESSLNIKENQEKFNEIRGYNKQTDIKSEVDRLNEGLREGESKRTFEARKRKQAEEEAGPNEVAQMEADRDGGPRARIMNSAVKEKTHFGEFTPQTPKTPSSAEMSARVSSALASARKILSGETASSSKSKSVFLDDDEMNIPEEVERGVVSRALSFPSPVPTKNVAPSMGSPGFMVGRNQQNLGYEAKKQRAMIEGRNEAKKNAAERAELIGAVPSQKRIVGVLPADKPKKGGMSDIKSSGEKLKALDVKAEKMISKFKK